MKPSNNIATHELLAAQIQHKIGPKPKVQYNLKEIMLGFQENNKRLVHLANNVIDNLIIATLY